jgi:DNA-binding CsgD family transcriptional regulator
VTAAAPLFIGRTREREVFDRMLAGLRDGQSAALVIRGEAGIGKTALIDECTRATTEARVSRIAGIESEMDLPFAALHQLCAPMIDSIGALPPPQERALRIAFGLIAGTLSDRLRVGLAVLSLLAEVAEERPLVCVVDDAQWLDEASAQVLAFVGRRLVAESVLLVFAVRETGEDRLLAGLPELTLEGLSDGEARALLATATPGQLDVQVRDRIVAETRGNPLGLLELPRGTSQLELAGGFAVPSTSSVSRHLEDQYVRRVRSMPEATQQLMLLAASDATGDAALIWRAAQRLGIALDSAAAAEYEQLLEIRSRVRFRHPLVRSATYAAASDDGRRTAHLALAEATDPNIDPDRRVWHRALAAIGPDDEIAAELERTAGRAQARAGLAAAATFLQRSVALTAHPAPRAERTLAAAYANMQAGAFDVALGLLAQVEADAVDDLQRARAERLRAQIEWAAGAGREAPVLLLQAAKRLEPLDVSLARETYLHAWVASSVAGPLVERGGQLVDVSRAARSAADAPMPGRPCDELLDGLATAILDGRAPAQPSLRRAVDAFVGGTVSADDWLQWGILAQIASIALWDFDSYLVLSRRQVEIARESGALSPLSSALSAHGAVLTWCGEFEAARALADERHAVNEVTGAQSATAHLVLSGYRGQPTEVLPVYSATVADATARGEGFAVHLAGWAAAVLYNGLGQYDLALEAAESACEETYLSMGVQVVLPELIEAATRTGKRALADDTMVRLSAMMPFDGADWGAGLEARCRALVSEPAEAERWYIEAIDRLRRTPLRPDRARAQLLYGEWLRRENRRLDARHQLHAAFDTFDTIGAEAFAERTRRELVATGEKARKRDVATQNELTRQEEHIARLARDGRTNPEIGAELFLSARTVEWHLRHVFMKLGITSRKELKGALSAHNPGDAQ